MSRNFPTALSRLRATLGSFRLYSLSRMNESQVSDSMIPPQLKVSELPDSMFPPRAEVSEFCGSMISALVKENDKAWRQMMS